MSRIVVLGGGESGIGAAVLAKVKGHDTFLSDNSTIGEKEKATLAKYEIPYEEGGHTMEMLLNADEVIKSPGIPDTIPVIQAILHQGIPVISEIEFAGRYDRAKKICITGSNGKTTTTSIIYYLLKNAGLNVGLGGNIGASYAYQVATCDYDIYVLELSSFQLDGMYDFRADIAILLNITPDHLQLIDNQIWLREESESGYITLHAQNMHKAGEILIFETATVYTQDPSFKLTNRINADTITLSDTGLSANNATIWHADGTTTTGTWENPTLLTTQTVLDRYLQPDQISFWQLPDFIHRMESIGAPVRGHRVQLWTLLFLPLTMIAMATLGIAFSQTKQRRNYSFGIKG